MTQPQYFVGFNGPPGAGKDTLVDGLAIHPWMNDNFLIQRVKYAYPLKAATHALFGGEYTEAAKDKPSGYGPTWRELYIGMSEFYAKVLCGDQVFGRILVNRMKDGIVSSRKPTIWLCSDCGFEPEQAPVIEYLGTNNVKYIQVHRTGHTFAGDSRGYINPPGVQTIEYWNSAQSPGMAQDEFVFYFMQLINEWGWNR